MIMKKCSELLPDYFGFVQGLVDSPDFSLNISREMLQHDRQLQFVAKKLNEKIKSELLSMLKDERETYEKFYKQLRQDLEIRHLHRLGPQQGNPSGPDNVLFIS